MIYYIYRSGYYRNNIEKTIQYYHKSMIPKTLIKIVPNHLYKI